MQQYIHSKEQFKPNIYKDKTYKKHTNGFTRSKVVTFNDLIKNPQRNVITAPNSRESSRNKIPFSYKRERVLMKD